MLSINLGEENAGYTVSLYYYNEKTGELEFICADEVAVDGMAELTFTHASDYVIVVDNNMKAVDEKDEADNAPDKPKTSGDSVMDTGAERKTWGYKWIMIAGMIAIVVWFGIFLVRKKK